MKRFIMVGFCGLLMCQSYLNYKLQPLQLDHNFRIKFCRHVFSHIQSGIIYALQCNGTFFCEGIFMHLPTILGGVLKYFFIFKKSLIKRQGRNENKNTLFRQDFNSLCTLYRDTSRIPNCVNCICRIDAARFLRL